MKLSNIEFIRLLPQFMREDTAVQGLAAGLDMIIPGLSAAIDKLSTWDHVDELSDVELDELAWELNIPWYNSSSSISIKRDVIKNSDMVYRHLGTKWAVENVIKSYFGDGYITEWFDYGGDPGHFIVNSSNPSINNERLAEFLNLLEKVKRASATLDSINITNTGSVDYNWGVAVHDYGRNRWAVNLA